MPTVEQAEAELLALMAEKASSKARAAQAARHSRHSAPVERREANLPHDFEEVSVVMDRPDALNGGHGDEAANQTDDGIIVPRRVIFLFAGLLAVTAAATMLAGFGMGWATHSGAERGGAGARGTKGVIYGSVVWQKSRTQQAVDTGAIVVVAPPADPDTPDELVPIVGLVKYFESPTHERTKVVEELEHAGGGATIIGEAGSFALQLSPGEYRLLIVSRHSNRAGDAPIPSRELRSLAQVFTEPEALIGNHQYRWVSVQLRSEPLPLNIAFDP